LAPFGRRLCPVVAHARYGAYEVISVLDAEGPPPDPGQFFMLAASERWGGGADERPFLPRAFSVLRRHEDGRLDFLFEDVGPGTRRLCELRAGDELWLLGPLGIGFTAPASAGRALLVGGGIGVPPLSAWSRELAEQGVEAEALLGFRDGAHAEGARLLAGVPASVATDDGSVGHHGLVTDLLSAALDDDPDAMVYACGPPAMLEAVRALCAARDVPAQLALEAGMACGFGACYGCVVPLREGGYIRLCVDGPVLDAGLIDRVPAHA
jgi:NAD(P)H-flavin reductase